MVHARQTDEIGASRLLQDNSQKRMLRSSAARGRAPGSLDLSRRKTVKICSAVLFLSALVSLSLTSEHLSAAEAKLSGDYLPSYVSAAENGNAKSQYRLGLRFERGVGSAPDYARAADWYRKAARQGMRRAAFRLGLLYQDGRGIGRDHKLAVHWYRDAAEAGLPEAQFNLGYLYERGLGLKADGVQAAVWYRLAAMQDEVLAYRSLGMLYAIGHLVPRDDANALFWLSLVKDKYAEGLEAVTALIRRRGGPDAERKAAVLRDDWNAQR